MMNQILFFLSFTLLIHFHFSTTLAQSPAASPAALPVPTAAPPVVISVSPAGGPMPAGPPNITKILQKGGHFALFIRLIKTTHVDEQINSQLNDTNTGLTVFAPSDAAFSSLKSGTINSMNDLEQAELVQFHFVPTLISTTQFQTVSNPLRTQAGDTAPGQFPLNVTVSGGQLNVSTGVMNTNVSNPFYVDGQVAAYEVDNVLLPWKIFGAPVPTAAPEPEPAPVSLPRPKKEAPATVSASVSDGGFSFSWQEMAVVTIGVAVVSSSVL